MVVHFGDIFNTGIFPVARYITSWVSSIATMIRTNPFLLFTVGFVILGYVILVLGKLLSRD